MIFISPAFAGWFSTLNNELTSLLTTTTHNVTLTGASVAGSPGTTNIAYQFGKVVFVFLDFNVGSSAIAAFTVFAKTDIPISSAFDINVAIGVAQTGTSIQNEYLRATKTSDGKLGFTSSVQLTASKRYRASGAFIIP